MAKLSSPVFEMIGLKRMSDMITAVVIFSLPLVSSLSDLSTDELPTQYDHRVVKISTLGVALQNCSGSVPFSEADFRRGLLPAPPTFNLPPPPPFISSDCSATYSWQLVRNDIASRYVKDEDECSNEESELIQRVSQDREILSSSPLLPKSAENQTNTRRNAKDDNIDWKKNANKKSTRNKTKTKQEPLADKTTEEVSCTDGRKCKKKNEKERKKQRNPRGVPGPPGPPGPSGSPGFNGADGLPGLVMFPDAAAMFGVSLEGLIAYRTDVKQLFVRDHLTWRPIRVAKCGDGIVDRDVGEQCDDGNDDIHDDCLGCRRSTCGDGIRNRRTEECDGREFGEKTCTTYRESYTGSLTCTPDCQISYLRCRHRRNLRR